MRRESLYSFLPAGLAAVTDAATAAMVRANQPDYPGRFILFQIVMLGAALLAAVPRKWVRLAGLVLLMAGVLLAAASVGYFYLPTFFAALWVMVRIGQRPSGGGRPAAGVKGVTN